MIHMKPKKKPRTDAPIDPEKLQGYVKRIEAVEELIVAERDARTDIYTEVKASGMKPKMVRKIVKERAKKAVDEAEEAELERYRAALSVPGVTYRSVAAKTGVPKSTLHRLVPRDEKRDSNETSSAASHGRVDDASVSPPADVVPPTANPQMEGVAPPSVTPAPSAGIEAGTISCTVDAGRPCPNTCAREGRCVWAATPPGDVESEALGDGAAAKPNETARREVTSSPPDEPAPKRPSIMPAPTVWHEVTVVWQAAEAERKAAREAERERRRAAHAELVAKNAAIDADPLTLPDFLRRERVSA